VQPGESGFSGLTIDRTFTQLKPATGDSTSGNAFASLLLGYHNALQYTINPSYALHQLYLAPFVQDDWRVTNRLTVNLGGRWDYESPLTERYNKFVNNFCTTCAQPLATLASLGYMGGLQFASSSNRYAYPKDLNNFQPRLGIAYQVTPTTVLRAGYGIIYFNTIESPIGTGYSATSGNTSGGTGGSNESSTFQPVTTLSNPFPNGIVLPSGNSLGLSTGVGTNITFVDPHHVQPKAQQLAVNIQQALPGRLQVQIGYVNLRPSELEINQNINVLPQQYYSTSTDPTTNLANQTSLNTAIANPMAGKLPAGSLSNLSGSTIARNLLLVPFPEFGSVTDNYQSIGHQRYDALQIQVSHPMSHHVSFQGSLTWNKLIDWTSFANNYGIGTPLTKVGDPGPSLIGNVFGTVELPGLESRSYYTRLILGGWKVNTVMRAQNGSLISEPGSVYQIGDPLYAAPRNFQRMFNTCYEDTNGNLVMTSASVQACDSTSPAANPVYRQRDQYTVATNPYYINERQRIFPLVDASLFKLFTLREGMSFEIRGEFFNIGNRPNFGGPGTGLNSSTYGVVVLNQVNDARTGQLTARFNF
jgi:hypothetical protein